MGWNVSPRTVLIVLHFHSHAPRVRSHCLLVLPDLSGFFVGDFEGAISTAAASIWSGWGFPNFSPETAYAEVVVPALSEGTPIADVTEEWQQEYLNEAQVNGYDTAQ